MTFPTRFLAKGAGKFCDCQAVRFIGRGLTREGAHIIVRFPKPYATKILEDFGLENSKPVATPGTSTPA
eukprot:1406727-Alexandrium_andersonii.AAC.1